MGVGGNSSAVVAVAVTAAAVAVAAAAIAIATATLASASLAAAALPVAAAAVAAAAVAVAAAATPAKPLCAASRAAVAAAGRDGLARRLRRPVGRRRRLERRDEVGDAGRRVRGWARVGRLSAVHARLARAGVRVSEWRVDDARSARRAPVPRSRLRDPLAVRPARSAAGCASIPASVSAAAVAAAALTTAPLAAATLWLHLQRGA